MSAKRYRCLGDIVAQEGNLLCICTVCPNRGTLPAYELAFYYQLHRWPQDLQVIGQHIRCSKCGRRWPSLRISAERNPPCVWNYPRSDAQWKAIARRLRD